MGKPIIVVEVSKC